MTRLGFDPTRVVVPARRRVPHGGSGAYAIRALRDLRLGIKSESLERVA